MNLPKIIWANQPGLFKKTPLLLVVVATALIGFNVYLYLKVNTTRDELTQLESLAAKPPRVVSADFAQKIELGEESCPSMKAGNPNASLTFKLFESETCPYCIAQNRVLDELLPEYGDLFYGEWYDVTVCTAETEPYRISGVPTFVFTAQGFEKEPAYGFLDKQQLIDYICRVSEQC